MNKKYLLLTAIVLLALISGLLLGNMLASRASGSSTRAKSFFTLRGMSNKVDKLLSIIDAQYVDTVDVNELTEELMVDLVTKLDPHSVYIPASDLQSVNSELEGSFSGIGVQFNIQNDTIMILSLIHI